MTHIVSSHSARLVRMQVAISSSRSWQWMRVLHIERQTAGVQKSKPRPRYWYESRRRYFVKHFGVMGLLAADVAWGAGRLVGAVRRKGADACRLADMWRCDAPVILGRERVAIEGAA